MMAPTPGVAMDDNINQDLEHADALARTGFWGKRGAGAIVMARSTGRVLLAHRSVLVEQPSTWGCWGGAIDRDEDPVAAVHRELQEEAGYEGTILNTIPLFVFRKDAFSYENFLIVIDDEFIPSLNWESQAAAWFDIGDWPSPLHFGLAALFADEPSISTITRARDIR